MTPTFTMAESQSRQTFLALMWALSYPGRAQTLPDGITMYPANLVTIGWALLDVETTFFTPDPLLAAELRRTTAVPAPAAAAHYHFYPDLADESLAALEQAPLGNMLYPDASATVIIGCTVGQGEPFVMSGPGIQGETAVNLHQIPARFWELRRAANQYPLGWDIFLVDGPTVIGLPRTTLVQQ